MRKRSCAISRGKTLTRETQKKGTIMAAGERTSKQKVLFVLAIIGIVFGALTLVLGMFTLGGGALLSAGGADAVATGELSGDEVGAVAAASGLVSLLGVVILLSGGFTLLTGIFGVRGANDATKIMPYIVCAIITLVIDVVFLFMTGFTDPNTVISSVIGIVVAAIMVWLGFAIRSEGNATY